MIDHRSYAQNLSSCELKPSTGILLRAHKVASSQLG